MGGKSKQAQRTKNNARPSSSGRSAELLGAFGAGAVSGAALFPTLAAAAAPDAALSPDLALAIKKLNKKDPITKAKALQELNELVQNSKVEDVVAMLPNWTYFYKTLTVDPDRRVRELTQVCHGVIVGACGRRVAPHLKALLPSWLAAQHDEHGPARERARLALSSTFPENKLPEAISFCKTEVLTHMVDNLLDSNAAVNKKVDNEEERVASATRVACGALGGLRFLLARLPAPHEQWLWAELAPLTAATSFWKLHAHPAPEVRAAWYSCVGALGARFGARWGAACGQRAARLMLAAQESGAAAHALWAAFTQLLTTDEEWYSRLEKKDKDLLGKRLLETVESGGWGEASALWDAVAALLRLLPASALPASYTAQLLDAAFLGLEKRSVLGCKCERAAWVAGTGAMVRALAERADLPPDAAPCALARVLQAALAHPAPPARAQLAAALRPMLSGWAHSPRLELLVRGFWQGVASAVRAQLRELGPAPESKLLQAALDSHALLLRSLHDAHSQVSQKTKKQKGVKFADDVPEKDDSKDPETDSVTAASETETDPLFRHQLGECVGLVCAQYAEYARGAGAGGVRAVLGALPPLLELAPAPAVMAAMAAAFTHGPATPFTFWELGLHPWLRDEHTRCPAAVQVVFLLLPSLAGPQQAAVFAALQQVEAPVSDWVLPLAARSSLVGARAWLRSGCARAALLRAARKALAASDPLDTLAACLTPDDNGETPAGPEAVSEVLQLVAYVVQSAGAAAGALWPAARLSRLLAPAPAAPDLLAALLTHDLHHGDLQLESSEGDSEIRTAWREGVSALPAERRAPLVRRLLRMLGEYFQARSNELDIENILRVASLGAALAACEEAEDMATLVESLLGEESPAPCGVVAHALRHDLVAGNIHCPFTDNEAVAAAVSGGPEPSPAELLSWCRGCVLRGGVLRALCGRRALEQPAPRAQLAGLLHQHAVLRALKEGYAFSPSYETLSATEREVAALVTDTLSLAPAPLLRLTLDALAERALAEGFYWAYAAALHRASEPAAGYHDTLTGDGFFHSLQAELRVSRHQDSAGSPAVEPGLRCAHALMVRSLRAAHAHRDPALESAACAPGDEPAPDVVIDAYYRHEQTMLYDTDISSASWGEAVCAASVAAYLAELVTSRGWLAPAHHWDFVNISLCGLLASLDKAKHAWGTVKVAMVARSVLRLLCAVLRFVRAVPGEAERRPPSEHVAALPREWADVFAPTATHHAYSLLLHLLEGVEDTEGQGGPLSAPRARVVSELIHAARLVQWGSLPRASRDEYSLPRVCRRCAAALAAPAHHAYKYLAHATLTALTEHLLADDAEKLRAWSAAGGGEEGEDAPVTSAGVTSAGVTSAGAGCPPLALDHVDDALARLEELLDAALAHLKVGEHTCSTVPGSDTHSLALGLLLLIDALGELAQQQPAELALHYAERVRALRHADRLLPIVLRLLPAGVAAYATEPATSAAPRDAADLFLSVKQFSVDEPASGADVGALACRAVLVLVSGPCAGGARGWWGAAGGRAARALARLVRAYVAPHTARRLLRHVHERAPHDLPGAEVAVHWSAGEVTCCVFVEERRVELSIALSAEHPLSLPCISAPAPHPHSPAPSTHWLAVYLAYQNGSLLNALRMWAAGVSARVEAAPQCYICYCRLHPSSGRLPSVPCHQCRNKFHPPCLRKWFTSSNKSNCPLCRAAF